MLGIQWDRFGHVLIGWVMLGYVGKEMDRLDGVRINWDRFGNVWIGWDCWDREGFDGLVGGWVSR